MTALTFTFSSAPVLILALLLEIVKVINLTVLLIITNLVKVFTVVEVWCEWKESYRSRPAIQELEG